jgi:putative chitinase
MGFKNPTTAMVNDLTRALKTYVIDTPEKIQAFIAQCASESSLGRYLSEESGAAYEGREDLGNDKPGDGNLFKGAGFIKITGRHFFEEFAKQMNDPKIVTGGAEYVGQNYPWSAAAFWWNNNGMNALVEQNASIETISKKVNPTCNVAERQTQQQKAA